MTLREMLHAISDSIGGGIDAVLDAPISDDALSAALGIGIVVVFVLVLHGIDRYRGGA